MSMTDTIFSRSKEGRGNYGTGDTGAGEKKLAGLIPKDLLRTKSIGLPSMSESEVIRHFTALARKNYGVDDGIYPLGSCTMKYNPKINEVIADDPLFTRVHPNQKEADVQGTLTVMYGLGEMLKEITGLDAVSLQPSAGAHGEFAGLLMARKYYDKRGQARRLVIIPDSSHGTNFASASMAGFDVVEVKSEKDGTIDAGLLEGIVKKYSTDIALIMITNPNTLGIFEKDILTISDLMHKNGSLLYYDGANLNAVIGMVKPGDMGFDIVHLNLHKTFSTPHGGGGPGAGPVLVREYLKQYLPIPVIRKKGSRHYLDDRLKDSIGRVKSFYGNFTVCLKAYCYLLSVGDRLKDISIDANLNANYLKKKLSKLFDIPYGKSTMHEFVMSARKYKKLGGSALNIAKRLIDYGIHPPTVYFPAIVDEAMMVEPTETESLENLDMLVGVFKNIVNEIKEDHSLLENAPLNTETKRVDELRALKEPVLKED
jgi:glycine dehydrogenase subunit 2